MQDAFDAYEVFSLSIEKIGKNLQKYKNDKAAELGLRGIHVMLLYQLDKCPDGMTAAKLAEACGVNRAFVSRILTELLSSGLVVYPEADTGKRYRQRLTLTDAGRETVRRMNLRIKESVIALGNEITTRDMAIFYSVLRKLDRRLAALVTQD